MSPPTIVRLDAWLSLRARTHADRPAILAGRRTTSYAELESGACGVARRLSALGVGPGDRVATTLAPGADFARLLHAAPMLGAVLVPLDTRLGASERRARIDTAAPRVTVDEPLTGPEAEVELRSAVAPDAAWTLLFTSGTTGAAKPVLLSHRNHAASAVASAWRLGVAPDDRWLCVLPVFHVGGLAILIRSAVYGTAAVVHERFDTAAAAGSLTSGEATLVSLVPTMLKRLADAGLEGAPALRAILLGGAGAPAGIVRWAAARRLPVVLTYGMTEAASQVATGAVGGAGALPLPGVEIRVGGGGELLVRGPMVARDSRAADGWLHTGDRGHLDERGWLQVTGRIDDVIVSGGENVVPGEVEEALLAHPAVAEAGVAGLPDPHWGQAVAAFVVPAPGASPAPEELIEHCRDRLAGYKVPKRVRMVDALPRNAAGKLLRSSLADASASVTEAD